MNMYVVCLCAFQTAFSDFLSGSSKDLAKHIRVVVSRSALNKIDPVWINIAATLG